MLKQNSEIQRLKTIKDSTISKRFLEIKTLENQIDKLDVSINRYVNQLDSIERIKSKVRVVYKIKYKEIETFDDSLMLNYWKNQFKDD